MSLESDLDRNHAHACESSQILVREGVFIQLIRIPKLLHESALPAHRTPSQCIGMVSLPRSHPDYGNSPTLALPYGMALVETGFAVSPQWPFQPPVDGSWHVVIDCVTTDSVEALTRLAHVAQLFLARESLLASAAATLPEGLRGFGDWQWRCVVALISVSYLLDWFRNLPPWVLAVNACILGVVWTLTALGLIKSLWSSRT